jgi:hypothetical protein
MLLAALVSSCVRSLSTCAAKRSALALLHALTRHAPAAHVLDRTVPYVLALVDDPLPPVRAAAIDALAHILAAVDTVRGSDLNLFPEYVRGFFPFGSFIAYSGRTGIFYRISRPARRTLL